MFYDCFPITRRSGVCRCGFKDGRAHAVCEGSVDDVSVTKIIQLNLRNTEMNAYV